LAASWAAPDVLDLDRAGLVRQMGERGLRRDQPVEQVQLVVLEAQVEHVGLSAGRDVARHLEGHRGLAGALRTADEQQLACPQPGADRLVQRREPKRNGLVLPYPAARDLLVEVDQHIHGRARGHAPGRSIKAPGRLRRCPRLRRHVIASSRQR
jgi:hypothetical protein